MGSFFLIEVLKETTSWILLNNFRWKISEAYKYEWSLKYTFARRAFSGDKTWQTRTPSLPSCFILKGRCLSECWDQDHCLTSQTFLVAAPGCLLQDRTAEPAGLPDLLKYLLNSEQNICQGKGVLWNCGSTLFSWG